MILRQAEMTDIPQLMEIVAQAQAYLAQCHVEQWQNGYPDEAVVRNDIQLRQCYVMADDETVHGMATLVFDGEPSYETIYDGTWTTKAPYACIHRVAVNANSRGTGVANRLMQGLEQVVRDRDIYDIRIDTHRDNATMLRMLQRNGYVPCGIIYLEGEHTTLTERIALEKKVAP